MKPCYHQQNVPACPLCQLYESNAEYRALWDGEISSVPKSPAEPGLIRKAANFGKAVIQHAATGFQNVTEEQHEERMKACRACEFFNGQACNICGCNAEAKSWWKEQLCPHPAGSRWPLVIVNAA